MTPEDLLQMIEEAIERHPAPGKHDMGITLVSARSGGAWVRARGGAAMITPEQALKAIEDAFMAYTVGDYDRRQYDLAVEAALRAWRGYDAARAVSVLRELGLS